MKKIKLALDEKSADERVAQGNAIKTAMTGNPDFPAPNPPLPVFDAKIATLEAKLVARMLAVAAAKAATEDLHAAMADYDQTATLLAAYAENVTAGDAVKLEGGGFSLRSEGSPVTELGQVENLQVMTNGYPGRFVAQWRPLHGAKSYEVQLSADPANEASWKSITPSPTSKMEIDDLTSGQRLAVRVRGIAKKLVGPWSQQAARIVP